ncbi:hypothetical protein GCM10011396_00860 [Undibacterium terreum]|uniref:Uncharacterized protein n=1 Tax=Undibacterium terreum TaxID=1224302 RepID=A0A916U2G3_9BURK|nr:hypothetical protein GCM10011396_00860 [Undibacterium terreum]
MNVTLNFVNERRVSPGRASICDDLKITILAEGVEASIEHDFLWHLAPIECWDICFAYLL